MGLLVAIPILASLPEASETQFSIQKALKSNVGAFLPTDAPVFLSSVASSVDLFSLAALALLVVGMKKLPEMPSGGGRGRSRRPLGPLRARKGGHRGRVPGVMPCRR